MNRFHYIAVILIFLILLSYPQTLLSQEERLAVVSKFEGQVKVNHESAWKNVTKVGNRIQNSAVYNEDEIMTMPVSTADLVFNDSTHLEIKEDTTLTITTKQLSEEERVQKGLVMTVADTQRNVVRKINLKIGKLWADITPSKSVLTEFETPTGAASVRGTTIGLIFDGLRTIIEVFHGLMEFNSKGDGVTFGIEGGVKVKIFSPEPGKINLEVESGKLEIPADAGMVTIGKGGTLGLTTDSKEGGSSVDKVEGNVTVTNKEGTTTNLQSGTNLGSTNVGTGGNAEFESVIINTEKFQDGHINDFGNVAGSTTAGKTTDGRGIPYFKPGNFSQSNQTTRESSQPAPQPAPAQAPPPEED